MAQCNYVTGNHGHVRDGKHRLRVVLGQFVAEVGQAKHGHDLVDLASAISSGEFQNLMF